MADTRSLDITIRVRDQATAQLARLEQQLAAFGRSVAATGQRAQAAVAQVGPGARQLVGAGAPAQASQAQAERQAGQERLQTQRETAQASLQMERQSAQQRVQAMRQSGQSQLQAERQAGQERLQTQRETAQQRVQAMRQSGQSQLQAERQAGQERLQTQRETAQASLQMERQSAQQRVQAMRQSGQSQLQGERQAGQASIQAMRQAGQSQLQTQRQTAQASIQAMRQSGQSQLQMERQLGQERLQAMRQSGQSQLQTHRQTAQASIQATTHAHQAVLQADRQAFTERQRLDRQAYQDRVREGRETARLGQGARGAAAAFTELRTSILGMAAAVLSIRALSTALQHAVDVAMQFERMSTVLQMVNKDSGGAARGMAFVRAEAERLGADVMTLAQGYVRLSAATQGTTFAGKGTEDMLQGLNAAFRAYRLTSQEARDATRPLIQMFQSGTIQLDELRNELGTRVPTALKDMALAFNGAVKSETEMFKAMEQGRVTVEAARNAVYNLTQIWRQRYTPDALAAAQATDAAFNRLSTAWTELSKTIGDALLPALGEVARAFTAMVTQANETAKALGASGAITESIRQLGSLLIGLVGYTEAAGKAIAAFVLLAVGEFESLKAELQDLFTPGTKEANAANVATWYNSYKLGLEDVNATLTRTSELQQKLLSGGFAAPALKPGEPVNAQLKPVVLAPGTQEGATPAGKAENTRERAQAHKQRQAEIEGMFADLQRRSDAAALTETQIAENRLKALRASNAFITQYREELERIIAHEATNENIRERAALTNRLAADTTTLTLALAKSIPLEQAAAEVETDRLARTEEQLLSYRGQLATRRDLTREYQQQQAIITQMQTIDADLADGEKTIAYAKQQGLTIVEAEMELAVRRLKMSTEEHDALIAKLGLLRSQSEEYQKHTALMQQQKQILAEVGEKVRPQPRSERERLGQMREDLVGTGATPEKLAEFDYLAQGRIHAVAMNDVLETMRDTASSLGDTLQEALVDVLNGAALSAEGLGATMEKMGKGLIKLFGEEVITFGLTPLRKGLDQLAQDLARNETIQKLVGLIGNFLGLGLGAVGGGAYGGLSQGMEFGAAQPYGPWAHGGIVGSPVALQGGGLLAAPRLALLGEATPEAVVPLTEAGIARFTRGLQRGAPADTARTSTSRDYDARRWQETVDAVAKRPVVLEVTINGMIDPSKLGLQPEQVVQIVSRNIQDDKIIRRVIMRSTQR